MISMVLLILNLGAPGLAVARLPGGSDIEDVVTEARAAVCEKCAAQIASPNFNAPVPDRGGYAKMAEVMSDNKRLPPVVVPSQTVPGN